MKILTKQLKSLLKENPSEIQISDTLMQLGHENKLSNGIIDIDITPNRGDCLSLHGIARDLANFYGNSLDFEIYDEEIPNLNIDFKNEAKIDCPFIYFINVEVSDIPKKYKSYIEDYFNLTGLKKNNFFTDLSNFILYEQGQPTHCYDSNKLESFKLTKLSEQAKFTTLMDKEIQLSKNDLVFMNKNEIINFAGVMGGKSTSCSKETKSALIECAFFLPESVIGKSIKYGLNSDAAFKFERGVDPLNLEFTLRRFISVIQDHAEIKKIEIFNGCTGSFSHKIVKNDLANVKSILGIDLDLKDYLRILENLGFNVSDKIIVPSFRHDIETVNDIAEEVARILGYDNLPKQAFNLPSSKTKKALIENNLKSYLSANGFFESINYPFTSYNSDLSISIDNPLDSNKSFLRTSLIESLIENLAFNERRQKDSIKLFEISNVYTNDSRKSLKRVAIIIGGRKGSNYKDFNTYLDEDYLKTILFNIGLGNVDIKKIPRDQINSKAKYDIFATEFDLDLVKKDISEFQIDDWIKFENIRFKNTSEYPSVSRDLSFQINRSSQINDLLMFLNSFEDKILIDRFVFDFYENKKNNFFKLGYRFLFQSKKKTLKDSEVEIVMSNIVKSSLKLDGVSIPGIDL